LVNEIIKSEEGIAMAGQVLLNISKDERERARLTSEYKYAVDLQSKVVDAKRANTRDIAKNLLNLGDSIDKIITVTGLTREEVESLYINI
jgi:phage terminase Nu1 subunit (DNA packaging protein)